MSDIKELVEAAKAASVRANVDATKAARQRARKAWQVAAEDVNNSRLAALYQSHADSWKDDS